MYVCSDISPLHGTLSEEGARFFGLDAQIPGRWAVRRARVTVVGQHGSRHRVATSRQTAVRRYLGNGATGSAVATRRVGADVEASNSWAATGLPVKYP
jgi:hypothetical protein